MTKEERKELIDDIFAAAEDDNQDYLKEILVTLNNIEDDLSILVQYLTETI